MTMNLLEAAEKAGIEFNIWYPGFGGDCLVSLDAEEAALLLKDANKFWATYFNIPIERWTDWLSYVDNEAPCRAMTKANKPCKNHATPTGTLCGVYSVNPTNFPHFCPKHMEAA